MEGEVYPVDSGLPGHKFCAKHKCWWYRYAEDGPGVPTNIHPFLLQKEGVSRVNFRQRAPHPSQEMKDEPEESELLAELIKLITVIIEVHLKKLLPEMYDRIRVTVSRLPLNERSLAHPFGGLVINVAVATRGHRDAGDKELCIVIPFGEWVGGELGLFELGFLFRLRAWDAIIFPSCWVTHFNQHFVGERLSLVLHTDKHHDRWFVDYNGWMPRDGEELPCACPYCNV
ncbi:hypothetical protein C8F04DRAFT_958430 [Mycena alexandri]|uniref:Uncharacterized protein n=1 Tax=Mycena alexandri TaxID=1745969 RepID=A0AAD6WMK6_9AGAR|nr:hypothetical protein C8F04DRAFT_977916 [Mycena alexandri]KAJ7032803.1 hypothetical protein C8F04DRAFT_958430 [Mycena alexandri]